MAAPVSSKNPYDILGNDESDSDQDKGPVKTVDKPQARNAKRNTDGLPSGPKVGGNRGGRGGGATGVDVFGDKNATNLPSRPRHDDAGRGDRDRGVRRGRGGRGGRGGGYHNKEDRSGRVDTEKSVSQGWGSTTGEGEWNDEKAGEAMAETEATDAALEPTPTTEEGAAAAPADEWAGEPEDNSKSYADYLAEQEANKDSSLGPLQARKPNEGKQNKQWAKAKPLEKDDNEDFMSGGAQKAKRERQRKEKTIVDIDQRYVEPSGGRGDRGDRGGRGRGRGGDRGDRGGRGGGRGRGEFRGEYRGRGEGRGDYRGRGRGGGQAGAQVNVQDTNAFPSLGS